MRGWEHVTQQDVNRRTLKQQPKPSKYRNVATVVNGIRFDSKREAERYSELLMRERAGEIRHLLLQVPFGLFCPTSRLGVYATVSEYVADFEYDEPSDAPRSPGAPVEWVRVVEDAKGKKTREYELKKKWLYLQEGIEIRET